MADNKKNNNTELDEQRLSAILDNTIDGIITIDGTGHIKTFNKACTTIFGYEAEEVIDKNVKILMPSPYHEEHDGYLKSYQKTGKAQIIGIGREVKGKKKDGTIFPLELSVAAIEVDGKALYSGIVRDITNKKNAEEEILRSNMELERFAYVASHDLQEPLRMVISFTNLLEKRYGNQLDEKAREYIEFASDGARRMQELVEDLLEYARVGQEAETLSAVDMKQTMEAIEQNLRESIENTGAEIHYDDLPKVSANPIRLLRVLQNLIGNSIKYQSTGTKPIIHITSKRQEDGFWLISVKDNGIGMKQEYCKKIFEPFKRLHGKNEYKGTGMGLAICQKIIHGFDGNIWAESAPEKGTTFYFTVPDYKQKIKKDMAA